MTLSQLINGLNLVNAVKLGLFAAYFLGVTISAIIGSILIPPKRTISLYLYLPVQLLFAMRDKKAKTKIKAILSNPKITEDAVTELVELTLNTSSTAEMKNEMQLLIGEGLSLINKLPRKKLRSKIQALISFMLEDL